MKKKAFFRTPAQIAGIIILVTAGILFFINPNFTVILALFYIILCVAGSFFPQTNFLGPVISRGCTGKNLVALTFDDGPDESVTRQILDLLDKHSVSATFFVTGIKARRFPEIIKDILGHGHTIGNHSFHHNPFLMLKSSRAIYGEILNLQELLQEMGIHTLVFRPPVGIVNPKLAPLMKKMGMHCVIFSCRAGDFGNRRVKGISSKILKKIKADDIILLHDVMPHNADDYEIFFKEIENLLAGLDSLGLKVVPLSTLIGKTIMIEGN